RASTTQGSGRTPAVLPRSASAAHKSSFASRVSRQFTTETGVMISRSMPFRATIAVAVLSLTGAVTAAGAQQALPPVHSLGPIEHLSTTTLKAASEVRELPDRRVLLLDSSLTTATPIADSTSGTGNAYGNQPGGLIAFRGDSTLFIDPAS